MFAVLTSIGSGSIASPAEGQTPSLTAVTPSAVASSTPITLELTGSGFEVGAKVLVETTRPGRFVGYQAASVVEDSIELELPLGLPRLPSTRRIFVRNPDGSQTKTLVLSIEPGLLESDGTGSDATESDQDPQSANEHRDPVEGIAGPSESMTGPKVTSIWPSVLVAGKAASIEVIGEAFDQGAEVQVQVNVHAGSQRLPEYELRTFPAELIDEQTLEVRFDRGFFYTPAVRELVVINPDGGRSEPALLRLSAPQAADTTEE